MSGAQWVTRIWPATCGTLAALSVSSCGAGLAAGNSLWWVCGLAAPAWLILAFLDDDGGEQ